MNIDLAALRALEREREIPFDTILAAIGVKARPLAPGVSLSSLPVQHPRIRPEETALDCFRRAICGEQQQAVLEIHDEDGTLSETLPQSVTLSLEVDEGEQPPTGDELLEGAPFTIARTIGDLDGTVRLLATWSAGQGVVAAF